MAEAIGRPELKPFVRPDDKNARQPTDLEWQDEPRETLWRVVAIACAGVCLVIGGLAVVLPAIVVMVLALWALASVPIWLYRK